MTERIWIIPGSDPEMETIEGLLRNAGELTASARNYRFSRDELCYEDELPEDMTDEDYHEWFIKSYVDIVRIGPKPISLSFDRSIS